MARRSYPWRWLVARITWARVDPTPSSRRKARPPADVAPGIAATSHADAALSRLQSFENESTISALLDTLTEP